MFSSASAVGTSIFFLCVHVDFMLTADHLCAFDFFPVLHQLYNGIKLIPCSPLFIQLPFHMNPLIVSEGAERQVNESHSSTFLCEQYVGLKALSSFCRFSHPRKASQAASAESKRQELNPWVGKIPGGGHGSPLQHSCPDSPWACKESDTAEVT